MDPDAFITPADKEKAARLKDRENLQNAVNSMRRAERELLDASYYLLLEHKGGARNTALVQTHTILGKVQNLLKRQVRRGAPHIK